MIIEWAENELQQEIRTEKCNCGYKYVRNLHTGKDIDGKEFIQVNVNATTDNGSYYGGLMAVRIVACPECGALYMEP